jgi:hypothetical protein
MGKLDVSMKKWEKNPAMLRIIRMLEDAFNSIGEKIRTDLLKAYRAHAKESYDEFVKAMKTSVGEITPRGERFPKFKNWHDYVAIDTKRAQQAGIYTSYVSTWMQVKQLYAFVSVDYSKAEEQANYSYERARDSFVYKNIGKLANVLGARQDLKNAVIRFDWRGNYFKGNIQVYLEGAYFRGDVDIKYVIRRIPNVTPYFQYPLVFVEADVNGTHYPRPSEEELRILLGATKSAAEEKRELAAAAGICPMSGQSVPDSLLKGLYNRMAVYVRCPGCGAVASVVKDTWKFRSHKTPGAERAGAAAKLETAGYCPKSREKVSPATIATIGPVSGYSDPKVVCEGCGQMTRLDAKREWIFEGVKEGEHATKARVTSAVYYKHKLAH